MELAEKLGRTVGELIHGSITFRPISAYELSLWISLWKARAIEAEEQKIKQKLVMRRKGK